MDLKCPDSGECERNYWPNLERLKPTDQIKFVVARGRISTGAVATVRGTTWPGGHGPGQPVTDRVSPRDLAEWVLAAGLPFALQMQLHKLIWDPAPAGFNDKILAK